MKAVLMKDFGGAEVLDFEETDDPIPAAGQVLVDIHRATVNPADWKVREGRRRDAVKAAFPHILGRDFSGVVAELGDGVSGLSVGDAVFGVTDTGQEGCYAERLAIRADLCGRKPDAMSHAEAAALALTGLTAMISIEEYLELKKGETILIQGGAGGVGNFAVQFARHMGAHVVTTASGRNHDYLKSLGADEVIDYNETDFTEAVSDVDAVYDLIGGEVQVRSYGVLKSGGRLAWNAPPPAGAEVGRDDIEVLHPNVARDGKYMRRIAELYSDGAIRPPEIREMPLSEIRAAHELSATGHVRGKIVLVVR